MNHHPLLRAAASQDRIRICCGDRLRLPNGVVFDPDAILVVAQVLSAAGTVRKGAATADNVHGH